MAEFKLSYTANEINERLRKAGQNPDWNAAEGEDGHILNRTHWVEQGIVETLPSTTFTYDESAEAFVSNVDVELVEGNTYFVNYNGVEYECVCFVSTVEGFSVLALGNAMVVGGEDTGEPFAFGVYPEAISTMAGFKNGLYALDGAETVVLSIVGEGEIVHKIDDKYLGLDWMPRIENKEIIPTQKVIARTPQLDFYFGLVTADSELSFPNGGEIPVIVCVNGVEYKTVATADWDGDYAITENGEFGFWKLGAWMFIAKEPGTYTVSLKDPTETVHNKIPPEFLPDCVPYCIGGEKTDTLTFNGNMEGHTAVAIDSGVYLVNLTNVYVKASDFIGSTIKITDKTGNLDIPTEFEITENLITDGAILGAEGFFMDEFLVVSLAHDFTAQGITIPQGISVICGIDALWVSEIKSENAIFTTNMSFQKIDPRCIDLDFDWTPKIDPIKGKEVFPERTATNGLFGYSFGSNDPYYFIPNQSYLIEWNHKPYVATYKAEEREDSQVYGNFATKDFIIASYYDSSEAHGSRIRLDCKSLNGTPSEVTLAIYELDSNNKLPNAFLNLDWIPMYEEHKNIISNFSARGSSSLHRDSIYTVNAMCRIALKDNSKYRMHWDNEFYEVTSKKFLYNGELSYYFGNLSMIDSENENTNEPFLIILEDYRYGYFHAATIFMNRQNLHNGQEIALYDNEVIYNKLPAEYLPEGVPYIADMIEILPEFTITSEADMAKIPKLNLIEGKKYIVKTFGTEWECIATPMRMYDLFDVVCLGDVYTSTGGEYGTAPTGEPFVIVDVPLELAPLLGMTTIIQPLTDEVTLPISFSIWGAGGKKIDNRCLDLEYIGQALKTGVVEINLEDLGVGVLEPSNSIVIHPHQPSTILAAASAPLCEGARALLTFKYKFSNTEYSYHGYVANWEVNELFSEAKTTICLGAENNFLYFVEINIIPELSGVRTRMYKLPLATA